MFVSLRLQETLKAAWEEADVQGKWDSSSWGKKIATRKAKKEMTDFERYKAVVARTKVRRRKLLDRSRRAKSNNKIGIITATATLVVITERNSKSSSS